MGETYTVKTSDFVNVTITTPQDDTPCLLERRFNKSLTVGDIKVVKDSIVLGLPENINILPE